MDCLSLIISKQHSPLLLCMEYLLISITHQLDSLTPKVWEKLPVVLPYTASVPHHYCHLRRFRWPSKELWNRLPDVVCQLVGIGMVPGPWYLIRAEDTNLSHLLWPNVDYCDYCDYCQDYSDYCNEYSKNCFLIILIIAFGLLDYCDYCFWIIRIIRIIVIIVIIGSQFTICIDLILKKMLFDTVLFCRRSWNRRKAAVFLVHINDHSDPFDNGWMP